MKLGTAIFFIVVYFAAVSSFIYGLLLLETLSCAKGVLASFTFTNLFILWLLPLIVGLMLLAIQLVKREKH